MNIEILSNIPKERLEAIKNECYVEKNMVDMMTMVLRTAKVLDTEMFAERIEQEFGIVFTANSEVYNDM